jgi:hypothetical protein
MRGFAANRRKSRFYKNVGFIYYLRKYEQLFEKHPASMGRVDAGPKLASPARN